MPKFPEITVGDISVDEKYTYGLDTKTCIAALWDVYRLIKKIRDGAQSREEADKILTYLYCIGTFGDFKDDTRTVLTVDSQKKDKKAGAFFTHPQYLFKLERFGLLVLRLETTGEDRPRSKLRARDIRAFDIFCMDAELHFAITGIRLFALASAKHYGQPFYQGDIRVAYKNAPKQYAPPADEIFDDLPEAQRAPALTLHQALEALGCTRELERPYMLKYTHPKLKGQAFATL
jgi:hypothetical protein